MTDAVTHAATGNSAGEAVCAAAVCFAAPDGVCPGPHAVGYAVVLRLRAEGSAERCCAEVAAERRAESCTQRTFSSTPILQLLCLLYVLLLCLLLLCLLLV